MDVGDAHVVGEVAVEHDDRDAEELALAGSDADRARETITETSLRPEGVLWSQRNELL
jgi:hypothetical protein